LAVLPVAPRQLRPKLKARLVVATLKAAQSRTKGRMVTHRRILLWTLTTQTQWMPVLPLLPGVPPRYDRAFPTL
jgi:hypothetical protein